MRPADSPQTKEKGIATLLFLLFLSVLLARSLSYPFRARLAPLVVGLPTWALFSLQTLFDWFPGFEKRFAAVHGESLLTGELSSMALAGNASPAALRKRGNSSVFLAFRFPVSLLPGGPDYLDAAFCARLFAVMVQGAVAISGRIQFGCMAGDLFVAGAAIAGAAPGFSAVHVVRPNMQPPRSPVREKTEVRTSARYRSDEGYPV